jgi:hypothetical protein
VTDLVKRSGAAKTDEIPAGRQVPDPAVTGLGWRV